MIINHSNFNETIIKVAINFRLDKTSFTAMSFKDADEAINNYKSNTATERLAIANRLIAIAYNYPLGSPPSIDKSFFEVRNFKDGKHF